MKSDNLQFTIAGWLALATAIGGIVPFVLLFFFVVSSFSPPELEIFAFPRFYIFTTLVFIYLFITLEKLLKDKFKIDTASRIIIYLLVEIKLSTLILSVLLDNHPINVFYALKFSFGLALVVLGYKLNKLKDNRFGLNIFGMIMKVCGILYVFSGIPYAGIAVLIYAEIIQIFIAIAFSVLF